MDTIIELSRVSKSFKRDKPILNNIELSIDSKQCLAIAGHNGSGKSTLLKLIAGLTPASGGKVKRMPGTLIGYAPEHFPKIRFRAEEYLYAMGRIRQIPNSKLLQRIPELLERFNLHEFSYISHFSKGMAQKVNLLQAVLANPNVLILDEPLSGLDPSSQQELSRMLQSFKEEGITIVMTCHETTLLDSLADRLVVINGGGIESDELYVKREQEVQYRIEFSMQNTAEEPSPSLISDLFPSEWNVQVRHENELYVLEKHRDAVLLSLLQRGCSITSVTADLNAPNLLERVHRHKEGE